MSCVKAMRKSFPVVLPSDEVEHKYTRGILINSGSKTMHLSLNYATIVDTKERHDCSTIILYAHFCFVFFTRTTGGFVSRSNQYCQPFPRWPHLEGRHNPQRKETAASPSACAKNDPQVTLSMQHECGHITPDSMKFQASLNATSLTVIYKA